jgi:ABC-2 type transport system permease protein
MLLEGMFDSNFKNRVPAAITEDTLINFMVKSEKTSMIVVGDGDIIKNRMRRGQVIPLGEDRYTGEVFGNKSFIMNCVDYLCDDSGLMEVRAKEFRLRLLDKTRISEEKLTLQLISTGVPLALVLSFGFAKILIRKRRFSKMK